MVAEAVRTLASLTLMGVHVSELIVNQVLIQDDSYEYVNLPAHLAFDWYAERIAEQRSMLSDLDAAVGDVRLVLVPHLAGEPIGPKALGNCWRHRGCGTAPRRPRRRGPSSTANRAQDWPLSTGSG